MSKNEINYVRLRLVFIVVECRKMCIPMKNTGKPVVALHLRLSPILVTIQNFCFVPLVGERLRDRRKGTVTDG